MAEITVAENLQTECGVCGKTVRLTEIGLLFNHRQAGPGTPYCIASRCTPEESESRSGKVRVLRAHWDRGDAPPIARLTGVPYSPAPIPEGLDLDAELEFIVTDARRYIDRVYRTLFERRYR